MTMEIAAFNTREEAVAFAEGKGSVAGFGTRGEAVKFALSVAHMETGSMKRTKETAADPVKVHTQGMDLQVDLTRGDNLLLGGRNVMARYDSMVTRRHTAALCDQPRVVQRLDKHINILRAALGLRPEAPTMTRTSGMSVNQGVHVADPVDPWNREWMASATASALGTWTDRMTARGFAVSRRATGQDVMTWIATGSEAALGPVRYELVVLSGKWCASASRNGERLPLFDVADPAAGQTGVTREMASESWGGAVSAADAQRYLHSWSRLIRQDY